MESNDPFPVSGKGFKPRVRATSRRILIQQYIVPMMRDNHQKMYEELWQKLQLENILPLNRAMKIADYVNEEDIALPEDLKAELERLEAGIETSTAGRNSEIR